MFYEVIPTKVFRSGSTALTYTSDLSLLPGQIVLIPLGKTSCPGLVLKKVKKPDFPCKSVQKLLYKTPLPPHLLKSALWLSSYYLSTLPLVASLILPAGVSKTRRRPHSLFKKESEKTPAPPQSPPLNSAQSSALSSLKSIKNSTKLLFGVTGSGKTNIYLKLAEETLKSNRSVILLVPEIALTSQLVQIFESTFKQSVTLIHSKQTEAERHRIWEDLLLSKTPQIVIGPRSALFAPLKDLGLIIIDEAHETAYYQESPPKYSALRLASFLAKTLSIPCILGTATPLIADYYLAKSKNSLVPLTKKAKDTAISPEIKIVDFTSRESFSKSRYFSDQLLSTIATNLKNGHQTLIYHNRRGSAPMTICEKCGWQALCPNCFLPLTLHTDSYSLICHTCGFSQKIPSSCPDCHHPSILHKGFGTKLLESELNKLFTRSKIVRFDADNKKSETLDALFSEVKRGDYDIIIGTQTVSRGLDLPLLASIGIVQADAGLFLPDYSAEEKTFELLTQVIGRVGRGHLKTASVIIQTYKPDSPIINFAKSSDYLGFYEYLIKKRKSQFLPPFSYLAKITVTFKTEKTTLSKIRAISRSLTTFISEHSLENSLKISPPTPCFHERSSTGFSWQIVLRSSSRATLLNALSSLDPKLNPHLSIDPPSLL
ncbi:primosomal protein N' [Candidatus Saccharibacteria bacterium]|nr:primosomal protein N' [Candidatus Saccharibacteria bacterium]